ncbi:MAG: class I SAM-dependent methyltransferase [Candidatus Methanomethylophilaceae archaeon]
MDYSESNISSATSKMDGLANIEFEVADLREYHPDRTFDIVLCLYDVIGSFPEDSDNEAIMKTLASCCETGGYLAVSVMNMELTSYLAHPSNVCDVEADPKVLFDLPPGDVMHKSGDIFNPDLYLIDTKTGLVYRKEQFGEDSSLPAEYIIRDRRYTAEEITGLVSRYGFDIIDHRYVLAGRWNESLGPTDPKAKEILVIARKR